MRTITKFRRSIRAISPIISTLLLIAIAVAAALVAYAWVMGYMNFTTNKVNDGIQIQSVTATAGANGAYNLVIYAQNVGTNTVKFSTGSSLYLGGTLMAVDPVTPTTPLTLTSSQTGAWTATAYLTGATAVPPQTVQVKIVASDGSITQYTAQFSALPGPG